MELTTTLFNQVLLLEDDEAHALLIRRALKGVCSEVRHCRTLKESFEVEPLPDLIITDLSLPDSRGVEKVSRLNERFPAVPMIVLTSSNSLQDAVGAMKLGAKDFLVKNFDSNFSEILLLSLSRIQIARALEAEREALRREMEALREAIENSDDCLAVIERDGSVAYANRPFYDFCKLCDGFSHSLWTLFGANVKEADRLAAALREKITSLSSGAVWHTELSLAGSKLTAFDLSLSSIQQGGNRFVLWIRDISDIKRREKFQREMLSTTTHDLKGPLGAITLSAELLSEMIKDQGRPSEVVKRVRSAAQNAINLIDEFLSARRIQEGAFILKPSGSDIGELIRETCRDFEAQASVKRLSLEISINPEPLTWELDPMGIRRVLSNLLSNAVKFTPKDGRVAVRAFIDTDLHLAVQDSGPGMQASDVGRIFQLFSRLERDASLPGTGIGLFVVKSIVGAHGGKIDVTSKPDHGTIFEVVLPAQPPVNERGELICLDFA